MPKLFIVNRSEYFRDYYVKHKTRYIELYHQHKLEKIEHDKNREYYKEYYKRFMDGSMKD